jgi:hypothetical protein
VIGHICDLMMADQSWGIRQWAVEAGDRFSGTEMQTPARQVGWDRSRGIDSVHPFDP